ncbi:MAG: hypothetical protein EBU90_11245 [Proteobacteria bacterium]|jgi:hypothetical protein|nr:hypothetical protein [Pseudomonadota bacterium]NBP14798.1 hypothetical protein [bacterium]
MLKKDLLHEHQHGAGHQCGDLKTELMTHFPYGVFSVALGFIGVAIMDYFSFGATREVVQEGAHVLFHTFHFLHIVFAATGVMLTYFRFSKNLLKGIVIGASSTIIFCVLSDILLPYICGMVLGVPMRLHVCFVSELHNVLPFLVIGMINGWVLSQHPEEMQGYYSVWSHFAHIFVSSVASLLYMVSHGFGSWQGHMGPLFLSLIFAVVFPCTMSDVVVPMYFAKGKGKRC